MKRMAKPGYDVDILPWNVVGRSGVADELGIWSRLFMRTSHQGPPGEGPTLLQPAEEAR